MRKACILLAVLLTITVEVNARGVHTNANYALVVQIFADGSERSFTIDLTQSPVCRGEVSFEVAWQGCEAYTQPIATPLCGSSYPEHDPINHHQEYQQP